MQPQSKFGLNAFILNQIGSYGSSPFGSVLFRNHIEDEEDLNSEIYNFDWWRVLLFIFIFMSHKMFHFTCI